MLIQEWHSVDDIRHAIQTAKPGKFTEVGLDLILSAIQHDDDGIFPQCTDRIAEEFTEWEHVQEFADSIGMQYREDLTDWDDIDTSESHRGADDYFIEPQEVCVDADKELWACNGIAVVFKFSNGEDQ